ncbi:DUF4192 family protein [Microbacterium excoecariae]|uniref:DUF4192 family protein n=1 Tax=Microbacterium excoecariae TaxID=2715210 RepID=UPI001408FA01|nr:DUF4192 family protein [Microbacterium excoecariae]NHI16230.1 DUF4192 family protein [Microbacterium excoecariae]
MTHTISRSFVPTLLAAVPPALGFHPRDSVVIAPLVGHETRGFLRLDLPGPVDLDAVAATAVGHVCRVAEADAMIVIVYTDAPLRDGDGLAYDAFVAAIGERADACGLGVMGELCVASDGWAPYDDPAPRPLAEIAGDGPVAASQHEGTTIPPGPLLARTEARQRHARLGLLGDPFLLTEPGEDPDLAMLVRAPHDLFESAFAGEPPAPRRAALWHWVLASPALRDIVLTQWAGGRAEAVRTFAWQRAWHEGASEAPTFPLRLGGEGRRPDARRLRAALGFARELTALADGAPRGACLVACAWLSWALGASTHAASYAEQALAEDPLLSLADLILRMTDGGMLPEWVYAEDGTARDAL